MERVNDVRIASSSDEVLFVSHESAKVNSSGANHQVSDEAADMEKDFLETVVWSLQGDDKLPSLINSLNSSNHPDGVSAAKILTRLQSSASTKQSDNSVSQDAEVFPEECSFDISRCDSQILSQIISFLSEPEPRTRLPQYSTLQHSVELIRSAKNVLVITGAGISVACGIPDFRSSTGIYAQLHEAFPDLPNPQAMFDIKYFRSNPKAFFTFAKQIYPGLYKPSMCHRFIAELESTGRLLRNYTQNIDCLESSAGVSSDRLVQCHGSFSTATCCSCGHKVDCEYMRPFIMDQVVAYCPRCPSDAEFPVLKPDIVFFGESLGDQFHRQMTVDQRNEDVDLVLVIGSSMRVGPVNIIPTVVKDSVPQILINNERLSHARRLRFDVELLGDCDTIIRQIALRLGEGIPRKLGLDPATSTTLHETRDVPLPRPPRSESAPPSPKRARIDSSAEDDRLTQSDGDKSDDEEDDSTYIVANLLRPGSFVHLPPFMNIFPGAMYRLPLDSGSRYYSSSDDEEEDSPAEAADPLNDSQESEDVEFETTSFE